MSIRFVDLFCGSGGTSTGIQQACDDLGLELSGLAVNHWGPAINTPVQTAKALAKALIQQAILKTEELTA